MVARKQIQRLKKELSGVKITKKQNKGLSLESLKSLGQYEDEVRIK
jgi:biotin operon repressor